MGFKKQVNLLIYSFRNIQVYRNRTLTILIFVSFAIGMLSAVNFIREGMIEDTNRSLDISADIIIQGYNSGRITPVNNSIIPIIQSLRHYLE